MTTGNVKCRAKGGAAACKDPNCPERQLLLAQAFPSSPVHTEPHLPSHERSTLPRPGTWTERDTILFKTIHGSRLYGLHHANSDEDFYVVTPTRKTASEINAKQTIVNGIDTMTVDFASFVRMANKGIPQALETMFSQKSKSDFFEDYRQGYYASDPQVIHTYMRTIKSFSLSDEHKLKRHAFRLAHNLSELLYEGRFNPTLDIDTASKITRYAQADDIEYFKLLKKNCPIEVDWDISDKTF
jgi:hypothetical protein